MDFVNLEIEWGKSGSEKTMIEWLQEEKLKRRLTPNEMHEFNLWAIQTYAMQPVTWR